jgi:hypothetical protein
MDRELLKKIASAIVEHADYDIWKEQYNVDTAGYGVDAESNLEELVDIAEGIIEEAE